MGWTMRKELRQMGEFCERGTGGLPARNGNGSEPCRGEAASPDSIRAQKRLLRARLIEKRRGLDAEYRREADAAIRERLEGLPAYRAAGLLFCYVSKDEEVDSRQLIADALREGKRVAVPRCGIPRDWMEACEIHSLEELRPGAYGILEPAASCRPVPPGQIDLCIVPCLCVGSAGVRLGYGGGYYDRYLPRLRADALRVALAREKLQGSEPPSEPHDRPVDLLVTEDRVIFYENGK